MLDHDAAAAAAGRWKVGKFKDVYRSQNTYN